MEVWQGLTNSSSSVISDFACDISSLYNYLIPTQVIYEDYVIGDLHKERLNKTYPKILGREQSNRNKNALHIIGGWGGGWNHLK